jgi:hypothetical protein
MLLAVLSAFSVGFFSCVGDFSVAGNGDPEMETREVSSFNEIKSSGDYEVEVIPGDDYLVEVTAESNLLPFIVTDVDGNVLKIRNRGTHNLHNTRPMKVYVTAPRLKGVSLSGSGFMETGSFPANNFEIVLSGSGKIETEIYSDGLDVQISGSGEVSVSGECNHSDMFISGSGKILSYGLEQQSCHATISGSGDIFVNVEDLIDVKISGSGNLYYMNMPDVHSGISGSGKVIDDN